MVHVKVLVTEPVSPEIGLTLPFDLRTKSRLPVTLDTGEVVGLMLPRGTVLGEGDLLRDESGRVIEVHAAPEPVSTAASEDPVLLARACYHLGNRHVPLQISVGWVRYQHDHVLDQMLRELGLTVTTAELPFEPERGAYAAAHAYAHTHV